MCQLIQLHRDHWLAKSINVAAESLRLLQHARTVGTKNLFPLTVMNSVNAQYVRIIQLALGEAERQPERQCAQVKLVKTPLDYARELHLVRTAYSHPRGTSSGHA